MHHPSYNNIIFTGLSGLATTADSDNEDEVGAQAPRLTKQISNILKRYPEGGQILKVVNTSHASSLVII